jgi:hypothetical protein
MYRLILNYIFLISMYLSFYTHILVKNSGASYIFKIVSCGGSIQYNLFQFLNYVVEIQMNLYMLVPRYVIGAKRREDGYPVFDSNVTCRYQK